jgi:site-specific DNA-methyltransferase (adenine-specific)
MNVSINKIKPNPKNPRTIKDERFEKLKKSIQDFPDMLNKRPLVCFTDTDGKFVVLGGNMRLKAAKDLGLKELPIILADEWTEEQKAEFLIKDNVGFGEWDWNELNNDWDTEQLEGWGLEVPEFKVEAEAQEDDYEIPDELKTDIVLGDLFEIGEHRLLCGDSTDSDAVARLMDGQKADMVFTDPPYGVSYTGGVIHGNKINNNHKREMLKNDEIDLYADFIALLPLVIDNGPLYIFYATRNSYEIFKPLHENGIDIMAVLAWIKINTGYADMNSHYKNRYEPCVYAKVGKSTNWIGPTDENTTWEIEKDRNNKLHPTQKPISVPERAIKNHKADLIMDFFSGSGSTMVAAHQLKRKCYGMELDPKYCQVIIDRMRKLDPNIEIKRNGQPYKTGE